MTAELQWTTCRGVGCGRVIAFVVTKAGQHMPVDPEPVTKTFVRGLSSGTGQRWRLLQPDGTLIAGQEWPDHPDLETVTGYLPHWGSCPARKDFKRR